MMNPISLQVSPEAFGKQMMPEHDTGTSAAHAFMQQITESTEFSEQIGVQLMTHVDAVRVSDELADPTVNIADASPTTAELVAVHSQWEGKACAGKTLQIAELYESKHLAIGRLSYLDSQIVGGGPTPSGSERVTLQKDAHAGVSVGHLASSSSVHARHEATSSPFVAAPPDRTEQSIREKDRAKQSIVQLPELLSPWMRRRVSVSADEHSIQIFIRDYEANDQELDAIVGTVLMHAQPFHDGRKIAITVNGKSLLNEMEFTGGPKNAG